MKVVSETPVMMSELKAVLEKVKKRDNALNFRAERTEEYLAQFNTLDEKASKDLYKKIEGLEVPRLRPEHIAKLVDLLPQSPEEVKVILQGYTITLTKENLKRIADAITEINKKE